jgi:beta-phosphoglucomutase-like phosphatase (HAD superfamily)
MGLIIDKELEAILRCQNPNLPPQQPLVDHRIKAVAFDLDGVLVDAPEWHKIAFNMALEHYFFKPLTDEEHEKNFNGLSTRAKLKILSDQGRWSDGWPMSNDKFYDKKQEFTAELIELNCEPITRVIDTVEYANSIFGGKTCVVTNCSRSTAELMLKKSNLFHRFQFIITNGDVDGKIKPHPWPYLLAKDKMGYSNSSKTVLAIDDTSKGIMSAVDAKMRAWRLENFEDLTVRNLMSVLGGYRIAI